MLTQEYGLKNFRSGHTIWRCMADRDGVVFIEEITFLGKRVMVRPDSPKFKCNGKGRRWYANWYISDAVGYGAACAFDTRRKAERFAEEVEAGLHQEYLDLVRDHYAECDAFDDYINR